MLAGTVCWALGATAHAAPQLVHKWSGPGDYILVNQMRDTNGGQWCELGLVNGGEEAVLVIQRTADGALIDLGY